MKYILIDERKDGTGDIFTEEYEAIEVATAAGEQAYHLLTEREKKERRFYILESANPDEEAMNHFDGKVVKIFSDCESNLARLRNAAGLSQAKLAEASGVNFRLLQYYEQGAKDINKAAAITVYSLARALGCTVEDLLQLPEE